MTTVQIIGLLVILVVGMGFMMYLKRKHQKEVKGNLWCEYIPIAGRGYDKLLPIVGGSVDLKPEKDGKGKTYAVKDIATYPMAYPPGQPSFVQVVADKAVFFEDTMEPASNPWIVERVAKGTSKESSVKRYYKVPVIPPEWGYNVKNEVSLEMALATSKDLKKMEELVQRALNPTIIYIGLGVCVLGIVGLFWYMMTNLGAMAEGIQALRAALGV